MKIDDRVDGREVTSSCFTTITVVIDWDCWAGGLGEQRVGSGGLNNTHKMGIIMTGGGLAQGVKCFVFHFFFDGAKESSDSRCLPGSCKIGNTID